MTEIYRSQHKGSQVDEAVETVLNNDCQIKWGNIISGEISSQTDLWEVLSEKVDTSTTVNGHALTGNITLTPEDIGAVSTLTKYGVALSGSGTTLSLVDQNGENLSSTSYQPAITGGASTITSTNLTASRALASNASGKVVASSVTASELGVLSGITATTAELNNLGGVTSNVQAQLNGKQATITGAASSVISSNLTAGMALVSDSSGKLAASSTVSAAELEFLDGVTSNLQTQLNSKTSTGFTNLTSDAWAKIMKAGMPNYSAGISKTWGTTYTADSNGWLSVQSYILGRDVTQWWKLWINSVEVLYEYGGIWDEDILLTMVVPVAAGDTYRTQGGRSTQNLTFYPCIGSN